MITKIKKELFFKSMNRIKNLVKEHRTQNNTIALALWDTVKKKKNISLINSIKKDARFPQFKELFSDWWCSYISNLEMKSSKDFLDSGSLNTSSSVLSEEEYVPLAEELDSMGIDFKNKKFLMIGCGPFPETLSFVDKRYEINEIFGMDSNLEAIKNAEKILQIINPHNNVRLIHSDAQSFDFSRVDLVFVANGVRGKSSILDQINKTSHKDIEIILRNPIDLATMLYDDITSCISESEKWIISKRYRSSILGETILIHKK